jgi:hypothetical protein
MGHEDRQYEIPDHLLRAPNAQSRGNMRKDIGEAKITHTIFGRAKVRVIRERDKKIRAWLLTVLVVTALAAASWQGWIALQQSELAAPPLSISEKIKVSPPVFQPEDAASSAISSSGKSKQKTPTETVFDGMTTRRPPPPQQPVGLKASEPTAAKPVMAQPLIASKPQTAPVSTNSNSSVIQTDKQQPRKISAPIQPVVPTVSTPSASQPAADKPAVVAPPDMPLVKENASTVSPAGDTQISAPATVQP